MILTSCPVAIMLIIQEVRMMMLIEQMVRIDRAGSEDDDVDPTGGED